MRQNILGVEVSAIDMDLALEKIQNWVSASEPHYVCVTPAHSIMDAYNDSEFCGVLNSSSMTSPDGMSVAWILRLLGHKDVRRVSGSELMLSSCRFGLWHNWRHFFYGGADGVAEKLVAELLIRNPSLQVAGVYTPPFRPLSAAEDQEIVEAINRSKADIVWIGLSSPKQERWMAEHLGKLEASVMIGVGAAFDFISGTKPRAPSWIQQIGFEWLFRLASEPKRLWPRYRQYPLFVWLVMLQLLGLRDFPVE